MQKPDVKFFVPGFSKCGTTTLCSLLGDHPEIYIPEIKEPNFFSLAYQRGWKWYADLFKDAENLCCGEGSTFYTAKDFEQKVVDRLVENYPMAKFIFIARNPFTRIESSYREHHHSGHKYKVHVPHDLEQTLREFPNILNDTSYWSRLNAYRERFSDSQIHILFFEDLLHDQEHEMQKCFQFLGVDDSIAIENLGRQLNPGSRKRYDTPLMRRIRTNAFLSKMWAMIPERQRTRFESTDFLRKPFKEKIRWSADAKQFVQKQLNDEAKNFLQFAGKPSDYWDFDFASKPARKAA